MSVNIEKRWSKYKQVACKNQPKIFSALKEFGYNSFESMILEACSVEQLREREVYWIREKNSVANGYNSIELGTPITEQMRNKISKSLTGRKYSVEHRQRMSDAHKGIPRTIEAKLNIANARRGVSTITDAGRQRIRESNARRYERQRASSLS